MTTLIKTFSILFMKHILIITIFCSISLPLFASEVQPVDEPSKDEEDISKQENPPTYAECFEMAQQKLSLEQQKVQEQINKQNLPINVARDRFDVNKYNPKIKPKSSDIKASLEIDLPDYITNKKVTKSNSCKKLYGI